VSDAPFAVEAFTATFERLRLPIGLQVQTLTLTGQGVQIGTDPVSIKLDGAGRFEAVVDAASIIDFLTAKAPGGLKDFEVSLTEGKINVKAVLKILVELRAAAVCRLVIREKRQLWVELESADVGTVGAKSLIKGQIDQLNPIFDAKELPLPSSLETVAVEDGLIRLSGTVSPPLTG